MTVPFKIIGNVQTQRFDGSYNFYCFIIDNNRREITIGWFFVKEIRISLHFFSLNLFLTFFSVSSFTTFWILLVYYLSGCGVVLVFPQVGIGDVYIVSHQRTTKSLTLFLGEFLPPAGHFSIPIYMQSCDNFTLCLRHFRKSMIKLTIYWGIFRYFSFRTNWWLWSIRSSLTCTPLNTKQRKTFMPLFASICSYSIFQSIICKPN